MKNKAYYFEQGRQQAIKFGYESFVQTGSDSWQAKAFKDGYMSAVSRETSDTGKLAIESHLKCLANSWKKEYVKAGYDQIKREQRLFTKIKKLCKKHGLEYIAIINSVEWK